MSSAPHTWRLDAHGLHPVILEPPPPTLDAVSARLPGGVYTTFRTYANRTRVVGLNAHLDRLEDSAARLGHAPRLDRPALRAALRQVLAAAAPAEARVRVTLDLSQQPGTLYLTVQALQPLPAEALERGVAVRTSTLHRDAPEVKSTAFLVDSQPERGAAPADVFELLLVDEAGCLLEGASSNFFGVREGRLHTAGLGVLAGVTRRVVLDLARQAGLEVALDAIPLAQVPRLAEAFLTSSSRGVVPVVRVDDMIIGAGVPGPITRRLRDLYEARLLEYAEPIADA